MPVSPATAEHLAAGVVAHYQDAEAALTARIARNLAKGIDAPFWAEQKLAQMQEYERQARRLLADLEKKAASGVATAITEAYDRGGLSAVADLAKMAKPASALRGAQAYLSETINYGGVLQSRGSVIGEMTAQGTPQHLIDSYMMGAHTVQPAPVVAVEPLAGLRAVEALTQETLGNVVATHPAILRGVMDTYRSVIAESSSGVLLGDQTRRQAAQAALNRFAQKGITGFVDKAGRAWSMESYTEMAMRTGCGRAAVQGHVDRLIANGLNLVIVSDAPRECDLCRIWEGKVLSIGGVPVEMPEGTDSAFQVDSGAAVEGQGTARIFTGETYGEGDKWLSAQQDQWYEALPPDLKAVVHDLDLNHMTLNSRARAGALTADDLVLADKLDRAFASVPGLEEPLEVVRALNSGYLPTTLERGGSLQDLGWADTTFRTDWGFVGRDTILHATLPKGSRVIYDSHAYQGIIGEVTLSRGSVLRLGREEIVDGVRHIWATYEP